MVRTSVRSHTDRVRRQMTNDRFVRVGLRMKAIPVRRNKQVTANDDSFVDVEQFVVGGAI
jgi:hypothetical protein